LDNVIIVMIQKYREGPTFTVIVRFEEQVKCCHCLTRVGLSSAILSTRRSITLSLSLSQPSPYSLVFFFFIIIIIIIVIGFSSFLSPSPCPVIMYHSSVWVLWCLEMKDLKSFWVVVDMLLFWVIMKVKSKGPRLTHLN